MTAGEEQLAIQLVEAVQTIAQQLEKLAQPPETVLGRSETWEEEQAEATARQDRQVSEPGKGEGWSYPAGERARTYRHGLGGRQRGCVAADPRGNALPDAEPDHQTTGTRPGA